jgi:hypothetical protein
MVTPFSEGAFSGDIKALPFSKGDLGGILGLPLINISVKSALLKDCDIQKRYA